MSDTPNRTPLQSLDDWLGRWRVRLLWIFTAMLVAGFMVSGAMLALDGVNDPQTLQRSADAKAMVQALTRQNGSWPPPEFAVAPGDDSSASPEGIPVVANAASAASAAAAASSAARAIGAPPAASAPAAPASTPPVRLLPARWALGVDSVLIVPGYTGWFFLSFAFLFLRRVQPQDRRRPAVRIDWIEFALQALCIVPAAAATFDLAENGITMLAIEDAVSGVLADATVHDMNEATFWKWSLVAASSLIVAGLSVSASAARSPRRDPVLLGAAVAGAAAAVLLWPLDGTPSPGRALAGMLMLAVQWACVGRRIVHPEVDQDIDHPDDDFALATG